ncbi:hypothetical protein MSAN_02093500 [Mycena sanguinolenta]|uniref:Uncharacterized protein n=1 Tax=Mycena sanguinolenta TaxID=230812 RepID=A0A8H6XIJ5_9AGAR|nr:hypothetical protein MSAN_02093500 [Mycena sanguinolenta]
MIFPGAPGRRCIKPQRQKEQANFAFRNKMQSLNCGFGSPEAGMKSLNTIVAVAYMYQHPSPPSQPHTLPPPHGAPTTLSVHQMDPSPTHSKLAPRNETSAI